MTNETCWVHAGVSDGPLVVLLHSPQVRAEDVASLRDRLADDGYAVVSGEGASAQGWDQVASKPGRRFAVVALGNTLGDVQSLAFRPACAGLVMFEPPQVQDALALAEAVGVPVCLHAAGTQTLAPSGADQLRVYSYPPNREGFMLPSSHVSEEFAGRIAYSRTLAFLKWVIGPRPDLAALFREHLRLEFEARDADGTMDTMVDEPYVNHIPTMSGGTGHQELKRFYKYHFIPSTPRNRRTIILNEIVGADAVVLEAINCFTHDQPYDHFLPGLPPTGRKVEIPFVAIAKFKGTKLYFEHIYWDQASVLVQLGLLDPAGLPVCGKQQADKAMHPDRFPSNELMVNWRESVGQPL